ncbi:MAG: ribosome maturation factor RimM, partial [Chromatiales bacterium]|nr:ribosome maturation factor RimM [Chromatiales bacterium]
MSRQRLLTMGRLGAPYGVKGWMRVHSYASPPDGILRYRPWWIRRGGEWQPLQLCEGRPHGKSLVARLEGYEDREAVREL